MIIRNVFGDRNRNTPKMILAVKSKGFHDFLVLLLGDAGSREKGKFMTTGEYSRLRHHFSKGHFKSCTNMLF